ncbi:hypothetical protein DI392_08175 [Vibrio albus]|uniref:Zona occludens toxin N-terminal domain-containing protein n=1 Tax=Vibrio albus TaxID=2200953 RepID=A0A2U3BBQ3_9VIBR|nr:zonular occludens toxin domain-containing protein [Vibrio albus]PWI34154.1 hypothetical protein DI392_08175 [Vibrio albus]
MLAGFSGGMGAGKTLNAIKYVIENDDFAGREVYYHGIRVNLLDYDVCNSFHGFMYGHYFLENKSNKALEKKLLTLETEGRLAELEDFPYLAGQFASHNPMQQWLHWFKKLASKKRIALYHEALDVLEIDESELTESHIKELKLSWRSFDNPKKIHDLPAGAVILVDEVQNIWPPRPTSSKPSEDIKYVATHRHRGNDLVYISQDFKDVDHFIRRRLQNYTHIEFVGRDYIKKYNDNKLFDPASKNDLRRVGGDTSKRDSKYHGVYLSSVKHTHNVKFNKRLVKLLTFFALLLCVMVVCLFYAWDLFFPKEAQFNPIVEQVDTTDQDGEMGTLPDNHLSRLIPRHDILPFSAPVYDELTQDAQDYPKLFCIETPSSCKCFTQQHTIYPMSDDYCASVARYGYFDPFDTSLTGKRRASTSKKLKSGGVF